MQGLSPAELFGLMCLANAATILGAFALREAVRLRSPMERLIGYAGLFALVGMPILFGLSALRPPTL